MAVLMRSGNHLAGLTVAEMRVALDLIAAEHGDQARLMPNSRHNLAITTADGKGMDGGNQRIGRWFVGWLDLETKAIEWGRCDEESPFAGDMIEVT